MLQSVYYTLSSLRLGNAHKQVRKIRNEQIASWRTHMKDFLAVYGQQTAQNALGKTGTKHDNIILLLHCVTLVTQRQTDGFPKKTTEVSSFPFFSLGSVLLLLTSTSHSSSHTLLPSIPILNGRSGTDQAGNPCEPLVSVH